MKSQPMQSPVLRSLPLQRLSARAFAPFGDVLACEGARHYPINEGTTERYHDLARIDPGPQGRVIVSIFRGQPRPFPLPITIMERHPLGSQTFMPLQRRPYLVVVAEPGPQASIPGTLHAFLAQGEQGVNYAPGVWHHPLIAVDDVSDFLVIDRAGAGDNCDEVRLEPVYVLEYPPDAAMPSVAASAATSTTTSAANPAANSAASAATPSALP
jgi:ureidoglycolate lyase